MRPWDHLHTKDMDDQRHVIGACECIKGEQHLPVYRLILKC